MANAASANAPPQKGDPTPDAWKDPNDMPENLHVLFVEGYCQVSWMQNSFLKCPPIAGSITPFSSIPTFRVWCGDPSWLDESDLPPDAFGVDRCIKEIESGKYGAIVVVDYSNPDDMERFERDLGKHLQEFVRAGGVVALPSSESILIWTLTKFFDVSWTPSNYYRTTWGPCVENEHNINFSFGNGNLSRRVIKPYSAKGNTLKKCSSKRALFWGNKDSKTQSLVPMMAGRDVSKNEEEEDYDIIVAMHNYGNGTVAYFGDVNAESETIWLVAAFIESRSPRYPVDCLSKLPDSVFSDIMNMKDEGNDAFKNGRLDEAEVTYKAALEKFSTKLGSNGSQREAYVALWSNLALIYIKKEKYHEAESAASKALDVEWGHNKCSYRRALARLHISRNTCGGDLSRLREAMSDVINGKPGDATRNLLHRIEREKKRLEKQDRERFSADFASAMGGKLN